MAKKESKIKKVYLNSSNAGVETPLLYPNVSAGFPSPAEDFFQEGLDLNAHLIKHPASTFFVKVEGDSMINAGIFPDDILIVDRSVKPEENKIVIASLNGELIVKRLEKKKRKLYLKPENNKFEPIPLNEESDLRIWGVVIYTIHKI